MSLYKSSDSNNVKIGVLETVPIDSNYNIKEYIDLNGNSLYPFEFNDFSYKDDLKLKDIVVIQANYTDYVGLLFGDLAPSSSNNMCIIKTENNTVNWYLGSGS